MKENLEQNERVGGRLGSASYFNFATTIFDLEGSGAEERLISAVKENDLQKVEEILGQKNDSLVNVNARDPERGNTPLLWATIRGHTKMVQLLLQHGADVTLRNFEGQTAVEVASPQIRQMLLDAVDKGGPQRNLLQAAWQGNAALMHKILKESSVDINCSNSEGLTPLLLVTRDLQLFEKLGDRLTKNYNPADTVKELLSHRANANVQDADGRSCLHYVSSTKASFAAKLVKQLINNNCIVNSGDKNSFSPLHCASQCGNVEVALALLHGGADSNARSTSGTTPLHVSAINGHDVIATTLLKFGADITLTDNSGYTPFHVAKTKTVKNVLRQAWTEATQAKIEKNLHPIRNETSKRVKEGLAPPVKGGQVIFDSLSNSSLANFDALTPRRAAISVLQRQSTNAERARRAEEQRLREINQGRFGHTMALNTRAQSLQNTGKQSEKRDSISISPEAKGHDWGIKTANRRSPDTKLPSMKEHQLPVTVLGMDMDEMPLEIKMKRLRPNQQLNNPCHFRNNSDPTQTSRAELDCEDPYQRGRSQSKVSLMSDDVDEMSQFTSVSTMSSLSQTRFTPIQTPSLFERGRGLRQDQDRKPMMLDLDRMQLTNHSRTPVQGEPLYPHSRCLLPPTPLLNYGYSYQCDTTEVTSDVSNPSSKDNSPRTSFESDDLEEENEDDLDKNEGKEASRTKTILRQGSFHIEDTQVQKLSDSGCAERGSNRSSVASSSNSSLAGTPDGSGSESARNMVSVGLGEKRSRLSFMDKLRIGQKFTDDTYGAKVIQVESRNGQYSAQGHVKQNSPPRIDSNVKDCLSNQSQKNSNVQQPVIINITSASEVDATIAANTKSRISPEATASGGTRLPDNAPSPIIEESPYETQTMENKSSLLSDQGSVYQKNAAKTTVITVTAKPHDKNTTVSRDIQAVKGDLQVNGLVNKEFVTSLTAITSSKPNRPPPPSKKPKVTTARNTNKVGISKGSSTPTTSQTKPARPPAPTNQTMEGDKVLNNQAKSVNAPTTISKPLNVEVKRGPCSNSKANDKPTRPPPPDKDKLNASQENSNGLVTTVHSTSAAVTSVSSMTTSQAKASVSSQIQLNGNDDQPNAVTKTSVVTLHYSNIKKNQWPKRNFKSTTGQNTQTSSPANNSSAHSGSNQATPKTQVIAIDNKVIEVSPKQSDECINKNALSTPRKQSVIENRDTCKKRTEKKAYERKRSTPSVNAGLQAKVNMIEGSLQANSVAKLAPNDTKTTSRPSSKTSVKGGPVTRKISDYTGPIIRDAFEGLKPPEQHEPAITPTPKPRVKSAKVKRKVGDRPVSSKKSKVKKEKKVQIVQPADAVRVIKGAKGRKKSAKKATKDNLRITDRIDGVAFVSGQGWHIETDAVVDVTMADDTSSDEDESLVQKVIPDFRITIDDDSIIQRQQITRQKEKRPSSTSLPGALETSESEHHTDHEDVIDAEEVLDEVVFRNSVHSANSDLRRQSLNSTYVITPRGLSTTAADGDIDDDDVEEIHDDDDNKMKPIWAAEMKIRAHSPTNLQAAAPQTAKIINNFARLTNQSTNGLSAKETETTGHQRFSRMLKVQTLGVNDNNSDSSDDCDARSRSITRSSSSRSPSRSPSGQRSPKRSAGSSPSRIPRLTLNSPSKHLNIRSEKVTKTVSPKHQPSSPNLHGVKIPDVTESSSKTESPKAKQRNKMSQNKLPNIPLSKSGEFATDAGASNESPKKTEKEKSKSTKHINNDVVFEPEVDEAINEIFKNTPSMTLSLGSGKSSSDGVRNICSLDDLRNSWGSRTFREVPVVNPQSPNPENKEYKPEQVILDQLAEEFDVSSEEKAQFSKIMNSLKNMELTVSVSGNNSSKHEAKKGIAGPGRPPVPQKPPANASAQRVERSPRFVRKADSVQEASVAMQEEDSADSDVEFGSDILNLTSSTVNDDSHIVTEERVVTSRLGRVSSAMTNDSNQDDNETIHWKRGNMLGKGAFGTVWCGLTNAGGLIAVKQIELNINDMDKAEAEYEKIQQEVEILKTLNHRNIVSYLGTSLEENVVSIFMQFVPGGSIANILARFGALQEQVMRHYTRQIVEGVEYLHANNVIHRDIKGGNIMVMQDGVIKLIDFGCAKRLCLNVNVLNSGKNRLLKSMRGTPYWMAPEVVKETGYGTKSDIWSIGCTVFEMATRKPPWSERDPIAAIFAIGSDKPVPQLPNIFSVEARDFVKFCLTKDQSQRPSASELLEHAFLRKRRK